MDDRDTSPGIRQPEPLAADGPQAADAPHKMGSPPELHPLNPPYVSFWLRELPYVGG